MKTPSTILDICVIFTIQITQRKTKMQNNVIILLMNTLIKNVQHIHLMHQTITLNKRIILCAPQHQRCTGASVDGR